MTTSFAELSFIGIDSHGSASSRVCDLRLDVVSLSTSSLGLLFLVLDFFSVTVGSVGGDVPPTAVPGGLAVTSMSVNLTAIAVSLARFVPGTLRLACLVRTRPI